MRREEQQKRKHAPGWEAQEVMEQSCRDLTIGFGRGSRGGGRGRGSGVGGGLAPLEGALQRGRRGQRGRRWRREGGRDGGGGRRKAFEEVVGRHDRWFGLVGFGGGAQPQVGH